MSIRAVDLARELGVTQGRVSQLVASGKLDGCFSGSGAGRRFDLQKCAEALGRRLDPGQMLGNGSETRRRISAVLASASDDDEECDPAPPTSPAGLGATRLPDRDYDRYELARMQKAEEEARRLRRQNEQDEGTFVLAAEVERQVARMIAQEVAQFEEVLREGARRIADRLGVDFKTCRQILVEAWREHRGARSAAARQVEAAAAMSDAETAADV